MRIVFVGQTEVADVVRAVHRLLQRAQHHRLQQLEIRTLLDFLEQQRIVLGSRIVAAAERQCEFAEKGTQVLQLVLGRRSMYAVQAGLLVLLQKCRGAHVGGQHAFLDDTVRIVAHDRHDVLDLALFVEQHHRLGRFEIDGAALATRLVQRSEQLVQILDVRQNSLMHLGFRLFLTRQPGPHLVIGQPGM